MKVTTIPIEEAIGRPLAHDLTLIDTEKKTKGARFRRGHILVEDDLPVLRRMGRLNLSVLFLEDDEVHEDEAALLLAKALAGDGLEIQGPEEGRCGLVSTQKGVTHFDPDTAMRINLDREWSFATCPVNAVVGPGDIVAAFRILPLTIKRISLVQAVGTAKPFSVRTFMPMKVGLVTTGSEILSGFVQDAFREKMDRKLDELGGIFAGQRICGDGTEEIQEAIHDIIDRGADIVICTGGMSVDADDRTPHAIRSVADEIIFRGVPAIPGSNLMLARTDGSWIIGAPACVVHDERTTLDRLLIALFAGLGEELDVKGWGIGGLCSRCRTCIFPNCDFARLPA
ncbi:MAG: molybdopterin-binding protein [Thermovirga sp.]